MLLRQGTASAGPPGAKKCGAVESVSQPKVPLESGITSRKLAAKRRKNAAHGASRGWKVENDRAPEERKKGCDTDSEARAVGAGSEAALKRRSSTANPGFCLLLMARFAMSTGQTYLIGLGPHTRGGVSRNRGSPWKSGASAPRPIPPQQRGL